MEAGRGMIGGRRKRAEGNGLGEVVRAREWAREWVLETRIGSGEEEG